MSKRKAFVPRIVTKAEVPEEARQGEGGWGGKRKGAGHPPNKYPLHVIKIQCTPEELALILSTIPDTRKRTEILLGAK